MLSKKYHSQRWKLPKYRIMRQARTPYHYNDGHKRLQYVNNVAEHVEKAQIFKDLFSVLGNLSSSQYVISKCFRSKRLLRRPAESNYRHLVSISLHIRARWLLLPSALFDLSAVSNRRALRVRILRRIMAIMAWEDAEIISHEASGMALSLCSIDTLHFGLHAWNISKKRACIANIISMLVCQHYASACRL